MNDNRNIVSYEEQQEMGLVKRSGGNFVAPLRGEVLPPVRNVPQVVDPYAPNMPQTIVQETQYIANPITRAQALFIKVSAVTIFLSILTLCAMLLFMDDFFFLFWLALASAEWIATFIFMATLDYREQPAAQHRHEMDCYIKMMDREQRNRLKAMYGDDYER